MATFAILSFAALALVMPAMIGWQGRGWRGLALLLVASWALCGLAALALYRANQACLAIPGCRSHSGIVGTLLGGAALGYPVVAGALSGLGAWARGKRDG